MEVKKGVLQLVGKILQIQVEKDQKKWPPQCCGILHQPRRPVK